MKFTFFSFFQMFIHRFFGLRWWAGCVGFMVALPFVYAQETDHTLATVPTSGYDIIDLTKKRFIVKGDAIRLGTFCYQVTPERGNKRGAIVWPDKMDLTKNFRMDFVILAGTIPAGADGFALFFTSDTDGTGFAPGVFGRYFGIGGSPTPSIAVEIDTFRNPPVKLASIGCQKYEKWGTNPNNFPWNKIWLKNRGNWNGNSNYQDPSYDHMAVIVDGQSECPLRMQTVERHNPTRLSMTPAGDAAIYPDRRNVEDGSLCSRFTFVWDYISATEQRMRVFIKAEGDDNSTSVLRVMLKDNIIADYLGGHSQVWWGYSGATGARDNEQTVCIPTSTDTPPVGVDDALFITSADVNARKPQKYSLAFNDIRASMAPELWITNIVTQPDRGGSVLVDLNADRKGVIYTPPASLSGTETFTYRICDVPNPDRCYAKCATAMVTVTEGCTPNASVSVTKVSDDMGCSSQTGSGELRAFAVQVNPSGEYELPQDFTGTNVGDRSGTKVLSDGQTSTWAVNANAGATANAQVVAPTGMSLPASQRMLAFPPGSDHTMRMNVFYGQGFFDAELEMKVSVHDNMGTSTSLSAATLKIERLDADGEKAILDNTQVFSGTRVPNMPTDYSLTIDDALKLGDVVGNYVLLITVVNPIGSQGTLTLDDISFTVSPYASSIINNNYTYKWYRGTGNDATLIPGQNTRIATGLPSGTYVVEAVETANNTCILRSSPVEVGSASSSIVVRTTQVSPVTSCDSPNGALSAGVVWNGVVQTAGYTFSWFRTRQLTMPVAAGSEATGLSADSYTVSVTQTSTGCTASAVENVESTITTPTISLTSKTDATGCGAGATGSASVNSGGATAGFVFEWYNGAYPMASSLPNTPQFTGATQSSLAPGSYTVRAEASGSGCPSDPMVIVIAGSTGTVALSSASNESSKVCDVSLANGELGVAASYNGATPGVAGFNFRFFRGPNTLAANEIMAQSGTPTNQRRSLSAGQYTVEATHTNTSCTATATYTVASETPANPTIDAAEVTLGTNSPCTPANGSITAGTSVDDPDATGMPAYTFTLSSSISGFIGPQTNMTGTFTGLVGGDYTIRVLNNENGCQGGATTLRVLNQDVLQSIEVIETTDDNSCNTNGTGSVNYRPVSSMAGALLGTLTHELFRGHNTSSSNRISTATTSDPSHERSHSNLRRGSYRIRVAAGAGCSVTRDINIGAEPLLPTYDNPRATIVNNTSCVSSNGSVSVHLVDESGNRLTDYTGYTFTWTTGAFGSSPPLPGNGPTQVGLESDEYAVRIVGPNGCQANPVRRFEVEDDLVDVNPRIEVTTPLTACVESDGGWGPEGRATIGCDAE